MLINDGQQMRCRGRNQPRPVHWHVQRVRRGDTSWKTTMTCATRRRQLAMRRRRAERPRQRLRRVVCDWYSWQRLDRQTSTLERLMQIIAYDQDAAAAEAREQI